jgi:hypothetical protein
MDGLGKDVTLHIHMSVSGVLWIRILFQVFSCNRKSTDPRLLMAETFQEPEKSNVNNGDGVGRGSKKGVVTVELSRMKGSMQRS